MSTPSRLSPVSYEAYSEGTNKAVRRGWNPTPDLAATSRMGDALASIQATAPDPTSVYRYYDASGLLIYVGITRQGMGRNVQHNGKAEWWKHVSRQEVEHLPSRAAAMHREKDLIQKHRPPFNKQHNPDHVESRAAYLAFVATFLERPQSAPGLYNMLEKRLPLDAVSYESRRIVFRSLLPHAPLATVLRWDQSEHPVFRGRRRQYGRMVGLTTDGPFALITCSYKDFAPVDGFKDAFASLRWMQNVKPQHAVIRWIEAIEADWVPKSERV